MTSPPWAPAKTLLRFAGVAWRSAAGPSPGRRRRPPRRRGPAALDGASGRPANEDQAEGAGCGTRVLYLGVEGKARSRKRSIAGSRLRPDRRTPRPRDRTDASGADRTPDCAG